MKTDSMNQQWKREKAAELLGFKRHGDSGLWADWNGVTCGYLDGKLTPIPEYDEDLNLMAEAEKVLTDKQRELFTVWLGNSVIGHGSTLLGRKEMFKLVSATAAQRLDAWLEVMMEEKR